MCGIVFAIGNRPVESFVRAAHVRQHHRGPDGEGLHFEARGRSFLGFAHERLAIVDLSVRGAQPMVSASGRMRILFNGEVYNYRELAREHRLAGLRSDSDTEVVVELIEKLGIDAACRAFNGMWALIVHDQREGKILISRDRFGKKPLYYAQGDDCVYFASEMHSLLSAPGLDLTPDPTTAARFLTQSLQNIDEHSWLASVRSFPPASIATLDVGNPLAGLSELRRYWTPPLTVESGVFNETALLEELTATLTDAVRLRLHADVPVGIALSGGIDSSIIAAIANQGQTAAGQNTVLFSATNPGSAHDESRFIDLMAAHLGCGVDKFSLDMGTGNALFDLLKCCIHHNDGPVASFSNVLFYKLMEMARARGVTVVLTGQGADEAFCGYRKYPFLEMKRLLGARQFLAAGKFLAGFVARGTMLPDFSLPEAKRYLGKTNAHVLGPVASNVHQQAALVGIATLADRQWQDIAHYSVPYLCHYEDRMSMAWSREVRAPFLDYRVVELGLRMPTTLKMRSGWTKYALRRSFSHMLPAAIAWRKDKKGFVNPQDDWLRSSLKSIVLDMMSSPDAQVYTQGLVCREAYLRVFRDYCRGDRTIWFRDVFAPFVLEMWLQYLRGARSQ